ncbi:MAG: tetratricopeptide repeat protein [Chitinivibrionales bacterium]|nr:tetratricopeptide repeat protein [Chitinivibrionales bacterium]
MRVSIITKARSCFLVLRRCHWAVLVPVCMALLVSIRCTNHRLEYAHELLEAGNFLSARKIYSKIVEKDPENFEAHYGMGMSLCAEAMYKMNLDIGCIEDWYPAIYHMNIASNLQPNTREVSRTLAILHYNLGTCHHKEGNADAAIERLESAVVYDSTLVKAYNLLGALYHTRENFRKAEQCYLKVLDVQPEYAMAHFNLGAVAWASGDYNAAVSYFQKASELSPGNTYFKQWLHKAQQQSRQG